MLVVIMPIDEDLLTLQIPSKSECGTVSAETFLESKGRYRRFGQCISGSFLLHDPKMAEKKRARLQVFPHNAQTSHEWAKNAYGAGTTEAIPAHWKFCKERIEQLIADSH